jgi:hypothetical protein
MWADRRHTSLLDLNKDLVLSDWREKTPKSESRTLATGERSEPLGMGLSSYTTSSMPLRMNDLLSL